MQIWHKVEELPPREKGFQVFHRLFKMHKDTYNQAMEKFPQPDKEEGYQDFVARYLQAKGDPGVVGMVRVEESNDELILDAAVRYPAGDAVWQEEGFWSS